jgi:hypothetical protein
MASVVGSFGSLAADKRHVVEGLHINRSFRQFVYLAPVPRNDCEPLCAPLPAISLHPRLKTCQFAEGSCKIRGRTSAAR